MFRRRSPAQSVTEHPPPPGIDDPGPAVRASAASDPPGRAAETRPLAEPPDEPDAEARLDERYVRAAQRGELASFNALVARHERAVFNVCLRLLRDVATAEDATQDTFVKAWTSLGGFRGGPVRPWLLRIATNRSYDLLRARGRRPATSLDAEPYEIEPDWTSGGTPDEHPEAFAARSELSFHLERALAALPEDQRLAVTLADIQGYGYDEVAAITGVALGTVKSRISRARARLRQALRDDPASGELFARFGRLTGDDGGQRTEDRGPSGH